jgi:hypothetical protein
MRHIFAALLLTACGNSDQCAVNTPCSPGSSNHYQFCNGGGADDCLYITGDGHKFHCTTCGDCSDARSLVADWCATAPTTTPGRSANMTCTSATCPTGGRSYSFCSSSGASDCVYKGNDGSVFECASCSDCGAAAQRVANWCSGTASSPSGGGSGDDSCFAQATNACQTCCATNHGQGASLYAQVYLECGCGYCATSACTTAGDVCHGGSSQTSDCASCLNGAFPSCEQQVNSACASSSDCTDFLACAQRC